MTATHVQICGSPRRASSALESAVIIQSRQRNQVGRRPCTLISGGIMRGRREQQEPEEVRKRITLPLVTRQSRQDALYS